MASKKFSFLLGLIALICSTTVVGQNVGQNVWRDSSYYPTSLQPQYNEFLNNQYAFPPKPRNMWEVGVKGGIATIGGDVASNVNFGWGVHVRKALGYVVSLRMEYNHGGPSGLNWRPAQNYLLNPAWTNNGYEPNKRTPAGAQVPAKDVVYYNYKTKLNDLSLQTLFSFANIRFHRAQTKIGFYAIAGVGVLWYQTNINALNSSGQKYDFNSINANANYNDRKSVRSALKGLLDNSYETPAETDGSKKWKMFGKSARLSGTIGAGIAFRISRRFNIAIEDRLTFVKDDLLDGQRWQEHAFGDPVLTSGFDSYNFASVGLNVNIF
jgi:hypothetical protein